MFKSCLHLLRNPRQQQTTMTSIAIAPAATDWHFPWCQIPQHHYIFIIQVIYDVDEHDENMQRASEQHKFIFIRCACCGVLKTVCVCVSIIKWNSHSGKTQHFALTNNTCSITSSRLPKGRCDALRVRHQCRYLCVCVCVVHICIRT